MLPQGPIKVTHKHRRPPKTPIPAGDSAREDKAKGTIPFKASSGRHIAIVLLLAILVAGGYLSTLQNDFVWDDTKQILQNPSLKPGVPWFPLSLSQAQYPPEWDQVDSANQGLALIYSERGEYDRALESLDEARAADPKDREVQSARGAVLLQAGHWKEAERILRDVLQTNPNDVNALNGLGFIAWQDEHQGERAAGYFQKALQVHPPSDSFNASVYNSLGAVYCEMGRCSEGIAHLQRAVELTPVILGTARTWRTRSLSWAASARRMLN